jgi:hypothetical protein
VSTAYEVDQEIGLPAEPQRSVATVIQALVPERSTETQAFYTPATDGGWQVNGGGAIVSWSDVVAEAIQKGWRLYVRRATP